MTTPYDFLTNCDPVQLDAQLNASLGKSFDFSQGNFDPIEVDRRIAASPPPPPPGPTPVDYTYGSINYKEEFSTVPENSIQVRDGKVLISFKAGWQRHGLFCFRMYIPEQWFKILTENSPLNTLTLIPMFEGEYFTNTSFGYFYESMTMFLWDPNRDFSSEFIQVEDDITYTKQGILTANKLIDLPVDLIRSFESYNPSVEVLSFSKGVIHSLKQFNGGVWDSPEAISFYSGFYDYNRIVNGGFLVGREQMTVDPLYPPQKQVIVTPPRGLSYILPGLRDPFGYDNGNKDMFIFDWVPFNDQSWKFDGTDGELGRVAAGQPFPDEVADHIPEEWNTL